MYPTPWRPHVLNFKLMPHLRASLHFVLLPGKLGLPCWFPQPLPSMPVWGLWEEKCIVVWQFDVFMSSQLSSLLFNHLSLTYSCLLLGNICWAPLPLKPGLGMGRRNNRRRILASASWPSSPSPGRVGDGIWRSLSILYYQRGNCHESQAAFPECIHENILTVSSSMRGFSVNLHLQLNATCCLETFFLEF